MNGAPPPNLAECASKLAGFFTGPAGDFHIVLAQLVHRGEVPGQLGGLGRDALGLLGELAAQAAQLVGLAVADQPGGVLGSFRSPAGPLGAGDAVFDLPADPLEVDARGQLPFLGQLRAAQAQAVRGKGGDQDGGADERGHHGLP
ncbi:hypothetical protein ACWENQ_40910 [Nonomuraea sp. NPDC004354]